MIKVNVTELDPGEYAVSCRGQLVGGITSLRGGMKLLQPTFGVWFSADELIQIAQKMVEMEANDDN